MDGLWCESTGVGIPASAMLHIDAAVATEATKLTVQTQDSNSAFPISPICEVGPGVQARRR